MSSVGLGYVAITAGTALLAALIPTIANARLQRAQHAADAEAERRIRQREKERERESRLRATLEVLVLAQQEVWKVSVADAPEDEYDAAHREFAAACARLTILLAPDHPVRVALEDLKATLAVVLARLDGHLKAGPLEYSAEVAELSQPYFDAFDSYTASCRAELDGRTSTDR